MTIALPENNRKIWTGYASAWFTALTTALEDAGDRIRLWAQRRADRRRLMEYPDHILRDIGISRSEIDSALQHGRQGRPRATGDLILRSAPEKSYASRRRRAA